MVSVDRSVSGGAGCKKEILVLVRDVELDCEALRRRGEHAGHRQRSARLHLARTLRPDDRVDLAFDDASRVCVQRELGLVARLHLVQLVLVDRAR